MSFMNLWRAASHRDPPEGKVLDEETETDRFLSDEQASYRVETAHRNRFQWSRAFLILTVVNILILGTSVFLNSSHLLPRDPYNYNAVAKATSYYSPILKTLPIEYHDVQLNGTFWPPANPPFSRIEPGPEADAAWGVLERQSPDVFPITREDVISLGKDPETVARFPHEFWGMGSDAYVASLDALHKIHCLNEVRKMTFEDYGEDTPTKKKHGKLWWIHLRHCVDMLAQDLICHADTEVLTYNWMDAQSHPFPDFSINRKCRDFDALLSWHKERKVDMDKYYTMKKTIGVKPIPAENEYYGMYGFENSELFPDGVGFVESTPGM